MQIKSDTTKGPALPPFSSSYLKYLSLSPSLCAGGNALKSWRPYSFYVVRNLKNAAFKVPSFANFIFGNFCFCAEKWLLTNNGRCLWVCCVWSLQQWELPQESLYQCHLAETISPPGLLITSSTSMEAMRFSSIWTNTQVGKKKGKESFVLFCEQVFNFHIHVCLLVLGFSFLKALASNQKETTCLATSICKSSWSPVTLPELSLLTMWVLFLSFFHFRLKIFVLGYQSLKLWNRQSTHKCIYVLYVHLCSYLLKTLSTMR